MFKEAIIIAGGKGTRLNSSLTDVPKPMALIGDTPFLSILLRLLKRYGVERVILATGYMHQVISEYYGSRFEGLTVRHSIETVPMGTGGAIAMALKHTRQPQVLVLNGDSFFSIDLGQFHRLFTKSKTAIQLALKPLMGVSEYGSVSIDDQNNVTTFHEKGRGGNGLINGGVYALDVQQVLTTLPSGAFSFETEFLSKPPAHISIRGEVFDELFIDIGTPQRLEHARSILLPFVQGNAQ